MPVQWHCVDAGKIMGGEFDGPEVLRFEQGIAGEVAQLFGSSHCCFFAMSPCIATVQIDHDESETMIQRTILVIIAAFFVAACSSGTAAVAESSPAPSNADEPTASDESESDSDELDSDDEYGFDVPPPYDREYDVSELYGQVCVDCHGHQGDGQGLIDDGFNFATPADDWTNGPTVDGILVTLEDGIHDTAMVEFEEYKNSDRIELAEYILDLRHALRGKEK